MTLAWLNISQLPCGYLHQSYLRRNVISQWLPNL